MVRLYTITLRQCYGAAAADGAAGADGADGASPLSVATSLPLASLDWQLLGLSK